MYADIEQRKSITHLSGSKTTTVETKSDSTLSTAFVDATGVPVIQQTSAAGVSVNIHAAVNINLGAASAEAAANVQLARFH